MKRYLTKRNILLPLLLIFIAMQFFAIDKTNPPVELEKDFLQLTQPPDEIAANMKTMCYDCHSHESRYPWYTNIAPFSWRIKSHIDNGRKHLNFSLWGDYSEKKAAHKLDECIDMTTKHWMPTLDYKLMHGRLSDEEYTELATFFKQAKTQKSISHNFDYLLGSWKRTDDEEGNQTFESWQKESDVKYIGHSHTLKGVDTISQELMTISKPSEKWMLGVKFPTEPTETMFTLKEMDATSFLFESKDNKFPNLIRYEAKDGRLDAEISGGDMVIPFTFERM